MLIAFDCRIIRDKNPAGISRVVLEFLKKVLMSDRKNDYILIFDSLDMKDFVSYYLRHLKKKVKIVILPFKLMTISDIIYLPKVLDDQGIDVYYLPYYITSPFHKKKYKTIITVFDLIHFYYPKLKTSLARKFFHRFRFISKIIFKRVDQIITISVNTSRDLVRSFHVPTKKIKMIYMGVSDVFRPIDPKRSRLLMSEKYGVKKKYILYVGRNEPHKNIKALILAYHLLPEDLRNEYKLVLVGKEDLKYSEGIRGLIKKYGLGNDVVFTGYVEDSELPFIYSAASVFVFPSFYEGFGLPILEAMACGVPVVASNTSSLPEVGGEAATYTDPCNVKEMSGKIQRFLEDDTYRQEMVTRGFLQVKRFTWFSAANNLLGSFKDISGKGNNT